MSSLVKKSGGWNKIKRNAFANASSDFEAHMMENAIDSITHISENSDFELSEDTIVDFIDAVESALDEICSKRTALPRCVIDKIISYCFNTLRGKAWVLTFKNDFLPVVKKPDLPDVKKLIEYVVSEYNGFFTFSSTDEGHTFWSKLFSSMNHAPWPEKSIEQKERIFAEFVKANPECKKEINDYCK